MSNHRIRARRIGIDTYREPVIYMREDCDVCRAEGLQSQSRVLVTSEHGSIIATLHVTFGDLLSIDEAGLSEFAWNILRPTDGELLSLSHAEPLESFRHVRAKLYGERLEYGAFRELMTDVAAARYSDIELSAFVAAISNEHLTLEETVAMTKAMIDIGQRMSWDVERVVDKHCVGGLPGNRTTPIIVSIVAAHGLTMPKTSSRAITSPAGTADTMEQITRVALSIQEIRRVVHDEGGCFVWGGAVRLSPADDMLIRVERVIDVDSEAQLVASVLSKKASAGSTHVLIDIPVGPTAKVRSEEAATRQARLLRDVGREIGLVVETAFTDGSQPVGRGIGPALEARDVLAVLRNDDGAPTDLAERSCLLAGRILEMGEVAAPGQGEAIARQTLADGRAMQKFMRICEAQGDFREPGVASFRQDVVAPRAGRVLQIDNRRLSRTAKLAGAPRDATAGVVIRVRLDDRVDRDEPLFTVYAESPGELDYAMRYLAERPPIVTLGD